MSAAVFVPDIRFQKSLKELMGREKLMYHFSSTAEGLLDYSLINYPRIFILQIDQKTYLATVDLVRDLRQLFGAVATIVLIGEDIPGHQVSVLIGAGADNIFTYPFDTGLIEDFLFKSAYKELCRPFKYRHVPSGESPIQIKLIVYVSQINTEGILFESRDLIIHGTILSLDIASLLDMDEAKVLVRIISSEKTESGVFASVSEFINMEDDLRKRVAFQIKA